MSADPRLRWVDALVGLLLGAGAFTIYALTLAPTVLAGDAGEFQFAPYLLGVAHPTGYPLYCLLGWAWSHLLPIGDVAQRMNLFSAFWAALAVGLLYPTARNFLELALPGLAPWMARSLAALAAATFATTPTFWSQAIIAEVYGLHLFLVVALLYLLVTVGSRVPAGEPAHGPDRARAHRLLLLAAGCFGLGMAHHRTTLLLIPGNLAYLWLADRSLWRDRRLLLKALLLAALPLALYLYIPLRAPHSPYLHLPLAAGRELVLVQGGLSGFLDFVLGGPFGGSIDWSVDLGARLAMAWNLLRGEVGWVVLALALTGLLWLALSRRWSLLALTALLFAVTVGFNLFYTIGDIYVLFIPAYLVVVLWVAVALGGVARALAGVPGRAQGVLSGVLALACLALPISAVVAHYGELDQSRNLEARRQWEAILAEPLPEGAILVSNDRNDVMPMWYFQYVGDAAPVRPDLLGLFPLITAEHPTLGHVLDLALGTGRPAYLIKEMPGIEVKVEVEDAGRLVRVLGPAVRGEPANPTDLRLADAVALDGFDRTPDGLGPGDELGVTLTWQALGPLGAVYHTYVHLVDAAGAKVTQSDGQPGGVYYPTTLWRPGERLRDLHRLAIPDGTPAGVYRLVAGMYALAEDGSLVPLGEPLSLGEVTTR